MRALVYSAIGLGVAGLLAYGVVLARFDSTTDVDVRVWQSTSDAQALYISARPDGGSWRTLGTIPLGEGAASEYETTANGRFRYSDITLAVPLDDAVQPGMVPQDVHDAALARIADLEEQLAARPTATPDPTAMPDPTTTPEPTATPTPTDAERRAEQEAWGARNCTPHGWDYVIGDTGTRGILNQASVAGAMVSCVQPAPDPHVRAIIENYERLIARHDPPRVVIYLCAAYNRLRTQLLDLGEWPVSTNNGGRISPPRGCY